MSNRCLAIDPGPKSCGVCVFDLDTDPARPPRVVYAAGEYGVIKLATALANPQLQGLPGSMAGNAAFDRVIIEQVESYGLGFSKDIRNTVAVSAMLAHAVAGPYAVAYQDEPQFNGTNVVWVTRKTVKLELCGTFRGVNDTVVKDAVCDAYGGRAYATSQFKKCSPCAGTGQRKKGPCKPCDGKGHTGFAGPLAMLRGEGNDAWAALALALAWQRQWARGLTQPARAQSGATQSPAAAPAPAGSRRTARSGRPA